MAGPVDTRKRSREEEQNEFMPLSKRINNLHLNNSQNSIGGALPEQLVPTVSHEQYAVGQQQHEYANRNHHHLLGVRSEAITGHNNHLGVTVGSSSSNSNSSMTISSNSASNSPASAHISINEGALGEYCPVLTAEENPHYFTKNKILYELYVERMRRLQ